MFELSLTDWIEITPKTEVNVRSLGKGGVGMVCLKNNKQFVKETIRETSGLLDCRAGQRPLVSLVPCSTGEPLKDLKYGPSVPHQLLCVPDFTFSFLSGPHALGFD